MKKKDRIIRLILTTILIVISVGFFYFLGKRNILQIPCLFHKITGLHCPGCGMSRALISIIELDFYQAFRYNALSLIFLPSLTIYLILKAEAYINDHPLKYKISDKIVWLLLIIVIVFGILRNIPYFDFFVPIKL